MSTESEFNEIVKDLVLDVNIEIVDFSKLNILDVSNRFNESRDELLQLGELMEAKTERGRELHSIRAACLIEMRNRKLGN